MNSNPKNETRSFGRWRVTVRFSPGQSTLPDHHWEYGGAADWFLTPAGTLLAQSLKREREAQRKPVSRVVVEDVRFHICDGTAFCGAPDDLVMGKSSDEKAWNEHALFGHSFPHFDLDSPGNQRRHYVVVEVYEGWLGAPLPPPETER